MDHTYTKKLSAVYVKFKFNWASAVYLSKFNSIRVAKSGNPNPFELSKN